MSDLELRALVQRAEASDDAALWLRAAHALARSGRGEEAGVACLRARIAGAAPREVATVEDLLVPDLDAFSVREVGARSGLGPLSLPVLHGERLFVVESRRRIIEWDIATNERRLVRLLRGDITALAHCPRTDRLAVVYGLRLVLIDLATRTEELVARGVSAVRALALSGDVVTWIEGADVGAPRVVCRLDMARHRGLEDAWTIESPLADVDRSGSFVLGAPLEARFELRTFAPDAEEARHHAEVDLRATRLRAAGERSVVLHDRHNELSLIAEGALLASRRCEEAWRGFEPAPSGQQALLSDAALTVVDLRTGRSRAIGRTFRTSGAAWSPSGRRLALTTELGTVVLFEVPAPTARSEAEESASDEQWLRLGTTDRVWLARRVGTRVEVRYGRRGRELRNVARDFEDVAVATRELARRVRASRRAGYFDCF